MPDCRACCKCFTVSLVPVTVFSLAVLFFFGVILLPILYEELAFREQYGIVIDAGSTHSQVYLYAWDVDSSYTKDTRRVYQKDSCRAPGEGISYLQYNYSSSVILDGLSNCTHAIANKIPNDDVQSKTPLWLGATAGMRLVSLENASVEKIILSNVAKHLANITSNQNVSVLSGQVEASSGWLTANYLHGNFSKPYPDNKREVSKVTTVGAMDMGGASMQIAFEPQGNPIPSSYLSMETIFDHNYTIYARSYLCFGVNEANRRMHAFLVKDQYYGRVIHSPCLLTGDNVTINASDLFANHTCTKDLNPGNFSGDYEFTFVGTGDADRCQNNISRALNLSWCVSQECGGNGTQPSVNGSTFYAFSNFYYVADSFNISTVNGSTLDSFYHKISDFCSLTWSEAWSDYAATTSADYLQELCFRGVFVYYVLQDGFGFNKSSRGWTIEFVNQIDDLDVGWSLGYMLSQTNQISPSENFYTDRPYQCVDLVVGMVILTILCVVFAVFFLFTFSACRKALKPTLSGYSHIS